MQYEFNGISVNSEEEFLQLIREINTDIEFKNYFQKDKPAEELLDEKYLLSRYKVLAFREARKEFREEHDCQYCMYFENKSCKANKKCPLDEQEEQEKHKKPEKPKCPKDKEGNCPYGNESGTCFGFCWKDILKEYEEKRRKARQHKEEEHNEL